MTGDRFCSSSQREGWRLRAAGPEPPCQLSSHSPGSSGARACQSPSLQRRVCARAGCSAPSKRDYPASSMPTSGCAPSCRCPRTAPCRCFATSSQPWFETSRSPERARTPQADAEPTPRHRRSPLASDSRSCCTRRHRSCPRYAARSCSDASLRCEFHAKHRTDTA